VRITGGKARGIPLAVPRGDAVRPATDALRQALFSSIGARVEGARFLDLFAGSGAYGLEALSRGAASGLFVERDRRTVTCLEKNLAAVSKSLGQRGGEQSERMGRIGNAPGARDHRADFGKETLPSLARILTADVTSPSWETAAAALAPNLVFIDPPYEIIERIAAPLFSRLLMLFSTQMQPGGLILPLIIFEVPGGLELAPEGWHCLKRLGGKNFRQPSLLLFEPST